MASLNVLSEWWTSPAATIGLRWLIESAVSASLLFGVAGLAHLALRRAGAAWRHLLWATTLTGALLIPAASALGPRLALPGSDAPAWLNEPQAATPSRDAGRATVAPSDVEAAAPSKTSEPPTKTGAAASGESSAIPSEAAGESGSPSTAPTAASDDAGARAGPTLAGRALAVWSIGAIAVMLPLLLARANLRRVARRSERIRDAESLVLADEAAREVGLERPFVLLESREVDVPMTWGMLSPRVVLPTSAAAWTADRRRAVLMHELAHVRRHDCLSQFLAQAACAIYWFHPAAWMAARQLRVERERACDDLVLLARTRASDYADHLLEVVRSMNQPGPSPLGAVAFARPSQFEGRLLAVLDPRRRRDALRGGHAWRLGLTVLVAAAALATLRPWRIGTAIAGDSIGYTSKGMMWMNGNVNHQDGGRTVWLHGNVGHVGGVREPSDVIVVPADAGRLDQRWAWAMNEAKRRGVSGSVWVGYALPDHSEPHRGYATDTQGFDWAMLDENDPGLKLRTVVERAGAQCGTNDVAMLVRVSAGSGPADATRLRAQNITFGCELERRPLLWLGRIPDEQSAEWLMAAEREYDRVEMRKGMIDMLSIHHSADRIVPLLNRYARGDEPEELRKSAVEGLGRFPTEQSEALLVDLARRDPSPHVRREAVEALGQMERPSAADELLSIARDTRTPDDVRRHAIEAIEQHLEDAEDGDEHEAKSHKNKSDKHKHKAGADRAAAEFDASLDESIDDATSDKALADAQDMQSYEGNPDDESEEEAEDTVDLEVQRQAVESLGRFPPEVAVPRLRVVLRTNTHPEVRRQAIETLGRLDSKEARQIVDEAIWKDKHPEVQRQAVETLARYGDETAPQLYELAFKHPHMEVRRQAVESLGRCSEKVAVPRLKRLIYEGKDGEVQRQAVETLARVGGRDAAEELQEVVRSHPNADVRREAVDCLSRMDPELALPVLEELLEFPQVEAVIPQPQGGG